MSTVSRPPAVERWIPHRRLRPLSESRSLSGATLYAGEPENCRRRPRAFLLIMAQLGLMLAVFDTYRVENRSFRVLALLATMALPAHYLIPYRWKKPFFVGLSIVGMVITHGLSTSASVLAAAAVLLLLASAPIAWGIRAGSIAAVAAGLAWFRTPADLGPGAISAGFIPIVATMFMFRLIVFLYEQKHARGRAPIADTLSFFFVLPNVVFPHFPVIDYRTFRRGYFARGIHDIQRTGLSMMWRGTLHLLAYRAIDRLLLVSPDAVHDPLSLAGYLVCNYLLYLRVSGQFHMACGMLHLFGFELPETHHRYLLASSFTDYWRRINIYWKDFMVRVVFNPVAFRLRRRSQPVALGVATAVVFALTWLLHAYQSFWLRGAWGFGVPDALFWGILGVLVLINVQLEARRGGRLASEPRGAVARLALRALRIGGTFTTIAVLWSLWSSPSVASWLAMIRRGLGC